MGEGELQKSITMDRLGGGKDIRISGENNARYGFVAGSRPQPDSSECEDCEDTTAQVGAMHLMTESFYSSSMMEDMRSSKAEEEA